MKPDLLITWPRSCDYPLWRRFLIEERDRFAKVIISLTDHIGHDYTDWLAEVLDAELVTPQPGEWRDTAVNAGLDRSDAEWVWFTEQDFLITEPVRFWAEAALLGTAGGFLEDGRWHPASLFVRRDLIEQTSRYFGPHPVDHFWTFGRELAEMTTITEMSTAWEHLRGTTQNHHLIEQGIEEGIFRPDRFRRYLTACLSAGVPLHPRWEDQARRWRDASIPVR